MILHPVAIFGTSDKKLVVLLPMMLIFFVLKSVQVVLLCKSSDDILRHASLLYLVFVYLIFNSLPFLQRTKAEYTFRCMLQSSIWVHFFFLCLDLHHSMQGGEGRTNESPLKQSRLDQKEACKLGKNCKFMFPPL